MVAVILRYRLVMVLFLYPKAVSVPGFFVLVDVESQDCPRVVDDENQITINASDRSWAKFEDAEIFLGFHI